MVVANVAPIRWAAAAAVNASAEWRTRVWWEWVSQPAGGGGRWHAAACRGQERAHLRHGRLVCGASSGGAASGGHGPVAHSHRRQCVQPRSALSVYGGVHAWKVKRQVRTLRRLGPRSQ